MTEEVLAVRPAKDLSREAELLVTEHRDDADIVAARLADACFTAGDKAAGSRWTEIFLIIAAWHYAACERGKNACVTAG